SYSLGRIESVGGLSPESLKIFSQSRISRLPLPRVFGVFFNQNQARVFANAEVRQALDLATDKQALIDQALAGFGEALENALPPGSLGYIANTDQHHFDLVAGKKLLADHGWKPNNLGILEKKLKTKKTTATETLTFSIYTSNVPELALVAKLLKQQWEVLGASVTVRVFEAGDLNDNFIRPRKYDALLFGEVLGRNPDLFPFWHSSQRLDPGLNIAMYTNIKADKLLEEARATTDPEQQKDKYRLFQTEISKDLPAIFLYSPYYLYALPKEVKGATFSIITTPAERFENVYRWYRYTDRLWGFLAKSQDIINN
ncbi:MAG: ABC transporter substrate-binding protein, partial [Patescibacteria group bacterium]